MELHSPSYASNKHLGISHVCASPCALPQAAAFDSVSGNGRGARPGGRPALAARVGAEGGQAAYMFVAPLQELSMDDACGPEVGPDEAA